MNEIYKTYQSLVNEKEVEEITYSELLLTFEWKSFREKIISRDNSQCQKCFVKPNEIAWELKNSQPQTLYVRQSTEIEKRLLGFENIYSDTKISLNVHHRYYIKGKKPWEYQIESLITLCSNCHKKLHEIENIIVFEDETFNKIINSERCLRCSGTGYLPEYHYFKNGICFNCNGIGFLNL